MLFKRQIRVLRRYHQGFGIKDLSLGAIKYFNLHYQSVTTIANLIGDDCLLDVGGSA
jgi:hypothetical protein